MSEKVSVQDLTSLQTLEIQNQKISDTCVILHLYYPELWPAIASYLSHLGDDFDLFVTIPYGVDFPESALQQRFPAARLYRCENRGRDIAPFLRVFSAVAERHYKYICKIHTKKSPHIGTGQGWQQDMMEKLLGSPETVAAIKDAFDSHAGWGMIGPHGHVVPHTHYWMQNAERVITLAQRLGIATDRLDFTYVAGSMFWFRPEALQPLMQSKILAEPFEAEGAQQDATLAHAFERLFGLVAQSAGYQVVESTAQEVRPVDVPFQFRLLVEEFEKQVGIVQLLNEKTRSQEQTLLSLSNELARREQSLARKDQLIQSLARQLAEIRGSTAWSIALRITRLGTILLPAESRRGRLARLSLRGLRTWRREGLQATLQKTAAKIRQTTGRWFRSAAPIVEPAPVEDDGYVPLSDRSVDPARVLVKPIAFYLPQFHPIPENDAWWGEGFTEWTNVTKAAPNFEGHYQPHVPDDLGYYDLRQPDVQKRQVELAKQYGVYGFCFYYYWFAGKRLLERPLDQYLADPGLDLPFCLCWANENWTRRWDGAEHEILIGQTHNEQEYLHFIQDIIPNFRDPRYIRVDGKPMLLVYRINLLPDPQAAARIWREECKRAGIGEIYLAAVQSFGITDPRPYGFDAAVEFPPSHLGAAEVSGKSLMFTNPNFRGKIFDYNSAARIMSDRRPDGYTLFKSVMLSWDNTARRQNASHIFLHATPSAYRRWLEKVVAYTRKHLPRQNRFVFVNAWNEWAEGTHLEPDRRYGYGFLQATADAIQDVHKRFPFPPGWKILFVSHDAHKGGAQAALLSTLEWLSQHTGLSLRVLCLEGGALLPRFEALADTLVLEDADDTGTEEAQARIERVLDFCNGKPDLIYGNTVVAGKAYSWLHSLGVPILTHVYELEMSIRRYAAEWMGDVLNYSSHYIAPSTAVRDNLVRNHAIESDRITVVYGAVASEPVFPVKTEKEKQAARRSLGLERDKVVIVGCGLGMPFRKGADLFIELGSRLRQRGRADVHLYWIGGFDPAESDPAYGVWSEHQGRLAQEDLAQWVTFLGFRENFRDYFHAADIFVLPSREDPLPLVAIEAAKSALPLVCFAAAGGTPDLVGEDAGFVVPFEDVGAMTERIVRLMDDPGLRSTLGQRAREKFFSHFTVERTTPGLLAACRRAAGKKPAVSVIVPNYNHAAYLPERLDSIFKQTFQDFEVILLDDASTDNSLEILQSYTGFGEVRIHRNDSNTGSPFRQWLKGMELARAELLWIAESDDSCEPEFLERLLPAFRDPAVRLAYSNSDVIDEKGQILGDYTTGMREYLSTLSSTKWLSSYLVHANREINDGLGIKNTILNVSAVVLRRFPVSQALKEALAQMRIAGDWYLYVHAIRDGRVYYDAGKWNRHRRHTQSVIARSVSENKIREFFREFASVHEFIFSTYELESGFMEKWEAYLLQQLRLFSLGSSHEVLAQYYPFEEMRARIANDRAAHDAREEMSV